MTKKTLQEVAEETVRVQEAPDGLSSRVVALTVPGMEVPPFAETPQEVVVLHQGPSAQEAALVASGCRTLMVLALRSLNEVRQREQHRCAEVARTLGRIAYHGKGSRIASEIADRIENAKAGLIVLPGGRPD